MQCRIAPLLAVLAAAPAAAQHSTEFWPEASLYLGLNENARLFFDAGLVRGRESRASALEVTAALDLTLAPVLRPRLLQSDWQASRYLWTRLGYTRISDVVDGATTKAEDRLQLALYTQVPLPEDVWLEARARVDWRWIDGNNSTRYRFRLDFSREFEAFERVIKPYANVEWFYDSRWNTWSRTLLQAGVEARIDEHFRVEGYLAWQDNRYPSGTTVSGLGLVAKWYY